MKETIFVSFVVLAPHEKGNTCSFISELDRFAHERFENYEIILVQNVRNMKSDFRPVDGTKSFEGNVTMIRVSQNNSFSQVIFAGLERAMGDLVFELDLSATDYPLNILEKLYHEALGRFDVVSGYPKQRQTLSLALQKFLFRLFGVQSMHYETVRIVSRRALNAILNLKQLRRPSQALYVLIGYKQKAVEYEPDKPMAAAGLGTRGQMKQFSDGLTFGSRLSYRMVYLVSLFFGGHFAVVTGYGLYLLWFHSKFSGVLWLAAPISLGFSGLFLTLGFLEEKLYTHNREEPPYTIQSIEIFKAEDQIRPVFQKEGERK